MTENQNITEDDIEIIEFARVSDTKKILYVSNIPAKFHEDELQVNQQI